MASDAKIGSLIGLILIFVVAFVINGFTRFGRPKDADASNAVAADNTVRGETVERDLACPPGEVRVDHELPTDQTGDAGSHVSPPATAPTAPQTVTNRDAEVRRSDGVRTASSEVYYTVRGGDNLADIAKKFYGPEEGNKKANILRLFLANQKVLTSPDAIFIGQKLLIPPLKTLQEQGGVFSDSMFETVKSIGGSHPATRESNARQSQLYAVKEGDSLWAIAETLLGEGSRYREIRDLNAAVLEDEDHLTVGMRLMIPAE
ncbi:MAG: LysM peptidoglycan-binding domain-containing protein [Sedimentisphaerales bacterium]|jgi:nucleoid-associated protein YgaU